MIAEKTKRKIDGVQLIAEERIRQKLVEGWTEEHDRQWGRGELALAAGSFGMTCRQTAEILASTPGIPLEFFSAYSELERRERVRAWEGIWLW